MIEPLDFSKYVVPEFPHSIHFHKDNYEEAVVEWHQVNNFITQEFRADLEDYIMNYLAMEFKSRFPLYIGKIRSVVDIAIDSEEDWEKTVELAIRMLPLIIEDKV